MKYHNYEIKKVATDLGEDDPRKNYVYEIYKDGKYIVEALTLSTAKQFIDIYDKTGDYQAAALYL